MLGGLGLLLLRSNRNFQKTISVQCCRGISAPCSHLSMEHSHFRVNALNIPQNVVKVLLKVQIKDFTNWGLSQTFPSHPHCLGLSGNVQYLLLQPATPRRLGMDLSFHTLVQTNIQPQGINLLIYWGNS